MKFLILTAGLFLLRAPAFGTPPGIDQLNVLAGVAPKVIRASYFKLNGKSDFQTQWDAKTYSGHVSMRVYWTNLDPTMDKNSMDLGQARVQRLVTPKLPNTCQIHSVYGPFAPAKPVFAYTVSFGLWGIGCDAVIAALSKEKLVMDFEDVPSMLSGAPSTPFVRLSV